MDRIKKLIGQLLDYSRPVAAAEHKVAVNHLVGEVISFLAIEKTAASCLIRSEHLAENIEILADKDALQQVLINVLFNAIDATTEKKAEEREIVVTTCNEMNDKLGPMVVISVKDNGHGIDKEHLQEVFDPFFTTKEVGRGTGLGLFVCHTIIDGLGGNITIDNRMPTGIEVRIEIPLLKTAGPCLG